MIKHLSTLLETTNHPEGGPGTQEQQSSVSQMPHSQPPLSQQDRLHKVAFNNLPSTDAKHRGGQHPTSSTRQGQHKYCKSIHLDMK